MRVTIQTSWRQWLAALGPFFLCAALFALPISSSGKSIFLSLAVILTLFSSDSWPAIRRAFAEPWSLVAVALFMLALFACLWTPAFFSQKTLVLEKYSKLLYLPLLAAGFREPMTRMRAMEAFLVAMALTCLLSIAKYGGWLHFHGMDPGKVFRNHIMTGYMMAFAAYLSAWLAMGSCGKKRWSYVALAFLFSIQVLFVNTGRTGYVVFVLLTALFMLQQLNLKQALLGILLGCSALGALYLEHPAVHARVNQAVEDWHHYRQESSDNSIRFRLQFHEYACHLFTKAPWLGNGTGSFTHSFDKDKPVPGWNKRLLEPHSQYWLVAAEFGLAGLLALALFFITLAYASLRLPTLRPVAFAVLLPFLMGNMSDSLLFYSGTGFFFLLFMALCLGELIPVDQGYPRKTWYFIESPGAAQRLKGEL